MSSLVHCAGAVKSLLRIGFLVLFGLLSGPPALALSCTEGTSPCTIAVYFEGTYQEETCDVSIDDKSSSETVVLPTLSSAALQQDGSEAGNRSFKVGLKNCPINRTVALHFVSGTTASDTSTGNLTNTAGGEYSKNVQIRLRNESGQQMVIDNTDSVQDYVISDKGEDVTHLFSADYYAHGTSSVTAGLINTSASIDLIYK